MLSPKPNGIKREECLSCVGKVLDPSDSWTDDTIREILRRNLYGVDINPASVEITKLALWLHTARSDKPLSSLNDHIRDGNSLIGPEFYNGLAPLQRGGERADQRL